MSHATHSNAALTPRQRLKLAQMIVDGEVPTAQVAQLFMTSWKTAGKWAQRYRQEGPS
ncbi:MAG: helix-turn-helix domain-containing protein, partial [Actinomycetales bacterium]